MVLRGAAGAAQRGPDRGDRPGSAVSFWLYGAIGMLTLAFCWKLVPETKGKRLEEIEALSQARVKP